MVTKATTMNEIRLLGLAALARELGPYGLVRFLQQYEMGSGDYTRDRHEWLGNLTVSEIAEEIVKMRRKGNLPISNRASRRRAA